MDSERSRLCLALRSPAAWLSDESRARAEYLLRSHGLEQLAQQMVRDRLEVLLVKGAALALTHYPRPWQREMSDIDLLVRPEQRERAVAALQRAGCQLESDPVGRRWSARALGETAVRFQAGTVSLLVELHTQIDKVVARPVDYRAIFERSLAAPGPAGFRIPCAEDHALLVAVHCAASEFQHPAGLIDLELLFRQGLDVAVLGQRARRWRVRTAMFVALVTLRALGAPSVSQELVERFRPSRLRRGLVASCYRLGDYPLAARPRQLGWRWVLRQVPLRDDLARWTVGAASYAAKRALERVVSR